MIDHCFDKLEEASVETVVVNTHYLPDAVEAHLASADYPFEFRVSDERSQLMETGGGLVKAEPLIDEDIFFSINSDNLWTDGAENSFQRLADDWNDDRMDGLLLLVPRGSAYNYNGSGDFELDNMRRISRRRPDSHAPYVWTGIQLLSKRFLRDAPDGPFSTNILWDRAIGKGRLFGIVHDGEWFEVGSPDAIEPTEKALASV